MSNTEQRVLCLNATYEPLTVVRHRRAVVLVLMGEAEVVEVGDGVIRSPSLTVPIPSVIRLLKFVRVPYRTEARITNRGILTRDNHICRYCGAKATTVDHVHPRSKGGKHHWENVVAACYPCNERKGSRTLAELGWRLDPKPVAPITTRWVVVGVAAVVPAWEPYLAAHA